MSFIICIQVLHLPTLPTWEQPVTINNIFILTQAHKGHHSSCLLQWGKDWVGCNRCLSAINDCKENLLKISSAQKMLIPSRLRNKDMKEKVWLASEVGMLYHWTEVSDICHSAGLTCEPHPFRLDRKFLTSARQSHQHRTTQFYKTVSLTNNTGHSNFHFFCFSYPHLFSWCLHLSKHWFETLSKKNFAHSYLLFILFLPVLLSLLSCWHFISFPSPTILSLASITSTSISIISSKTLVVNVLLFGQFQSVKKSAS